MRNRFLGSMMAMAAVVAVVSLVPAPAAGQAPTAKARTWDPPRTPDGQPDMQGIWAHRLAQPSYNIETGGHDPRDLALGSSNEVEHNRVSVIVDPADRKVPYQPWAAAKKKEILENHPDPRPEHLDPVARCFLGGVPRLNYQSSFQILQLPGFVVFSYEFTHAYRIIRLDRHPHVGENVKLWMGDSRGQWEGNTLVVDVTNLNDQTWFDIVGDFHSDALHVVERWTLVDADTVNYEATIEDPRVYARPWKMAFPFYRNKEKGYEVMEMACHEGNHAVELSLNRPEKTGKEK